MTSKGDPRPVPDNSVSVQTRDDGISTVAQTEKSFEANYTEDTIIAKFCSAY